MEPGLRAEAEIVRADFARAIERQRDEARDEVERLRGVLKFIRDAGGTTSDDAEFGQINYDGSWCGEQARIALDKKGGGA